MTMQTAELTVRKTVTVEAPQERAFDVFTAGFDRWWPRTHHIGDAEMAEAIIECREGGRAYERGVDGSECDWGRVLECDPPNLIVFSWNLNGDYEYDPDPEHASEVAVTFVAEGPDTTRVDLEHRNLERHGAEGAEKIRSTAGNEEGGWGGLLELFRVRAER